MAYMNSSNKDLVWDVEWAKDRVRLTEFLDLLDQKIGVYSETCSQIYTQYEIHFPSTKESNLIILPGRYAFAHTYNDVGVNQLRKTSLFIYPKISGTSNKMQLFIRLPVFVNNGYKRVVSFITMPLSKGLDKLIADGLQNGKFLPVIMRGDLRSLTNSDSLPCLRLHNLCLDTAKNMSRFTKDDLATSITANLESLKNLSIQREKRMRVAAEQILVDPIT